MVEYGIKPGVQIPSKKGGRENYKYYDVDGLGGGETRVGRSVVI